VLEAAGFAQIYQADLAKIGVNGVIHTLEPAALLDARHTQTYGLYFASDPWSNLEPLTQYTSGSTTNYRGNNGGYLDENCSFFARPSNRRPPVSRTLTSLPPGALAVRLRPTGVVPGYGRAKVDTPSGRL
jgi:hypothetical protein